APLAARPARARALPARRELRGGALSRARRPLQPGPGALALAPRARPAPLRDAVLRRSGGAARALPAQRELEAHRHLEPPVDPGQRRGGLDRGERRAVEDRVAGRARDGELPGPAVGADLEL